MLDCACPFEPALELCLGQCLAGLRYAVLDGLDDVPHLLQLAACQIVERNILEFCHSFKLCSHVGVYGNLAVCLKPFVSVSQLAKGLTALRKRSLGAGDAVAVLVKCIALNALAVLADGVVAFLIDASEQFRHSPLQFLRNVVFVCCSQQLLRQAVCVPDNFISQFFCLLPFAPCFSLGLILLCQRL